ncbi:enoyl-CoA hydratase-related protein [Actinomadura sp. 7K507]|uniref:enoyl-CoA hydratase/isomerase family protein n=1 Tax=Actinomadura sp. 7K507 TaxID=2530365 RepID=UPI001051A30B|nr:enoyl-CoA hydratase-related protein [Actinomadura sp. 7K507]TDC90236.1 enoyl-CoA hydratase/isomerase family protein [Actinomadura sp. 7K507]
MSVQRDPVQRDPVQHDSVQHGSVQRGSVQHEVRDGVLVVRIDRENRRNALDQESTLRLVRLLEDAALDESLRAVHLTAAGRDFCSGSDWVSANSGSAANSANSANSGDSGDRERPRPASLVRRLPLQSHRLIELLLTIHLPVVATVRGFAAGLGCQLALAADFTVADEDATFWEPFVHRGFTPDTGATWLLPRLVGLARARRMLLLGEKVSGAQAAEWGLIHEAVPAPDLDDRSNELVASLAKGPTVALGLTKQSLLRAAEAPLTRAMSDESYALELAARTADFKEGLAAFKARRDSDFTGR